MAVSVGLSPIPVLQFFGNDGKPAVGGSLLTQVGGVNYPTYSDVNGTVALPNPIPLNSRGEASTAAGSTTTVFLQQGVSYTFTLSDANANQLWSIGNIVANALSIPYAVTSGTNTIVATFSPAITALVDGLTVNVKLANTTTASPTFNPNGLGATNIYYTDGVTQWLGGSGIQNVTYTLVYNSSLNSSAGGWEVQNPSRISGSFTGTLTGCTTAPTATFNYAIEADGKGVSGWCIAGLSATSNTNACTITGAPAITKSGTVTAWSMPVLNNGASIVGGVYLNTSTVWALGDTSLTNFTASGSKGWLAGFGFRGTLD